MAIHKYMHQKPDGNDGIYKQEMLPIMEGAGIPIYISRDGKVHAKGFVDTNDNFEFYSENDQFKVAGKDDKPNYFKEYILTKTDNKLFRSQSYEVLGGAFQNIYYPLNPYSNEDPPDGHRRYNLLSKKTKSDIKSFTQSTASPVAFHFHFFEGSNRLSEPRVQSSWFGPFNVDVWIDPELMVQDVNDLILIKSGKFVEDPLSPTAYNVESVLYSTGVSGHVYINTPSVPDHNYDPASYQSRLSTRFKFKNKDNANKSEEISYPATSIGSGVIGVFHNGVFAASPVGGTSYNNSGEWLVDTVYVNGLDQCNGEIGVEPNLNTYGIYNYKAGPTCLIDDVYDDQNHSSLLGYAKDGFPIYGPYGYTQAFNSTSPIKRMETSYRLKQVASRVLGPSFSGAPSGVYVDDYEHVNNLGDLDDHNGRTCSTPEYPNGTYAYFTTLDSGLKPVYPYIVGPTFHGKASGDQGHDGAVTESPVYYRTFHKDRDQMLAKYPDPELNLWEVYGDTNRKRLGIASEKIVFVSPHVVMQDSGIFLHTGKQQSYKYISGVEYPATYSGNLRVATGNGEFLAKKEMFSYPTSMHCKLLENNPCSGGMNFLYEDPDSQASIQSVSPITVTGTYFYSQYKNHKKVKDRVHSGQWNGIIPAGSPFKIESWAFNGEMAGYVGKLTVRPVAPHSLTSGKLITIHSFVTGEGDTYDKAYADAMEISKEDINKKINVLLVNSGVKDKNSRMKAWEKLKDVNR